MLYLILFGLSFYQGFITLLTICAVILFIVTISSALIALIQSNNLAVIQYRLYKPDLRALSYTNRKDVDTYLTCLKILKYKWWTLVCCLLILFLPCPKTVYIASGFALSSEKIETLKSSPIGNKAYILLEKKLNQLLESK